MRWLKLAQQGNSSRLSFMGFCIPWTHRPQNVSSANRGLYCWELFYTDLVGIRISYTPTTSARIARCTPPRRYGLVQFGCWASWPFFWVIFSVLFVFHFCFFIFSVSFFYFFFCFLIFNFLNLNIFLRKMFYLKYSRKIRIQKKSSIKIVQVRKLFKYKNCSNSKIVHT
jgi:hypothetical protein